jgi:hypothetical protein
MKSPEYITHGTPSEKDAEDIKKEGFEGTRGRAQVSADLIFAFEYATQKRNGSKSETEIDEGEVGRMIIMKVPEDKNAYYSIYADNEIDKRRYEFGRKHLSLYNEIDLNLKDGIIENLKEGARDNIEKFNEYLLKNNIDFSYEQLKSRENLNKLIKTLDIDKQIDFFKKVDELEKQLGDKRKLIEIGVNIGKENILMSIVPTPELGETLNGLKQKIKNLETIDFESFVGEISKIIENNKENFLANGLDVREIIENLVKTTLEAEVINMIRSLSTDVKRSMGKDTYVVDENELKGRITEKNLLINKLKNIKLIVEEKDFDIGMENLNKYIKINIIELLKELGEKSS